MLNFQLALPNCHMVNGSLKWVSVPRDFLPLSFFHDTNPSEPLINRLKYFWIRFCFSWDIESQSCLCGVQLTAEIISAVCCTPLRWYPRYVAHCWDDLLSVKHTAEMISALCNISQRLSSWCATYRGDDPRGVWHTEVMVSTVCCNIPWRLSLWCAHTTEIISVHTTESISAVCNTLQRWSPRCATYRRDKLHTSESKLKSSMVNGCQKIISRNTSIMKERKNWIAKNFFFCTPWNNMVIKYIDEIGTKFENTLACLSGAQIGSNHKKLEVKNLVTHSLSQLCPTHQNQTSSPSPLILNERIFNCEWLPHNCVSS